MSAPEALILVPMIIYLVAVVTMVVSTLSLRQEQPLHLQILYCSVAFMATGCMIYTEYEMHRRLRTAQMEPLLEKKESPSHV